MTAPTHSRDPFEAALAQHLKAQAEPVPPQLVAAVDGAVRVVAPKARTGWAGDLRPQRGIAAAAFSTAVAGLLVVVGMYLMLGGSPIGQPSEVAAPAPASETPTEEASEPEPSLETMVLENGTVLDPEVVALLDQLVGGTEHEPTPMPSPDPAIDSIMLEPRLVAALADGTDPTALAQGPNGAAYYIDQATESVWRVDTETGTTVEIVAAGTLQRNSEAPPIGVPVQLTAAGPDVVIVDGNARAWRWRPSNQKDSGTLARLRFKGRNRFEANHGDVEAYDPMVGNYRIYVAEPSLDQVMRYQQTFDGSAFSPPSPYLASQTGEVAEFEQLYIDFDVYALFGNTLRRLQYGRYDGAFALEEPSGGSALTPDRDYRLVDGSGRATSQGRLYLYDAANERIVGFDKVDGGYLAGWQPAGGEMADVRGMYVIEGGMYKKGFRRKNDTLVWITPEGIYEAKVKVPEPT